MTKKNIKGPFDPQGQKIKFKIPTKEMKKIREADQDVIDLFLEEQEKKEIDNSHNNFDKDRDNYNLYDFLDLEKKRLELLKNFLSIKIPNMKSHNQIDLLLKKQYDKKVFLKESVMDKLKTKDSSFLAQMKQIFNQTF